MLKDLNYNFVDIYSKDWLFLGYTIMNKIYKLKFHF